VIGRMAELPQIFADNGTFDGHSRKARCGVRSRTFLMEFVRMVMVPLIPVERSGIEPEGEDRTPPPGHQPHRPTPTEARWTASEGTRKQGAPASGPHGAGCDELAGESPPPSRRPVNYRRVPRRAQLRDSHLWADVRNCVEAGGSGPWALDRHPRRRDEE
jgi:hypothetical protein